MQPGARHLNIAVASHDIDELVELLGLAGGLEGEAVHVRIDDAGAEDLRFLENRGAILHRRA